MNPARFEEVLGLAAPVTWLRGAIASGRLPHAMVFVGPEGIGKNTVARLVAAALLCEEPTDPPCGACASCRRLAHGSHPDLFVIGREPRKRAASARPADDAVETDDADEDAGEEAEDSSGELSRVIAVKQIRRLCEHAAYSPREGRARIFILDPADRMNVAAQNAILKTLEEPPGRAVLILVTARAHLLLPTVRSRCLSVRFAAMHVGELAARLAARGISGTEAATRAALAGGRPGRAIELDLARVGRRRDEVLTMLEAAARGPRALAQLPELTAAIVGEGGEAELLEGLELLEALLRDAALCACDGPVEALLHADLSARIRPLGRTVGGGRASELIVGIERMRNRLRFNLNEKVVADCLVAAIAGGPVP